MPESFQEYPKWLPLPNSTSKEPIGVIVNSKEEEQKFRGEAKFAPDKLTTPEKK